MNAAISAVKNLFPDLINYNKQKFTKDLTAGLVVGIVALPLSLALAIASGVPPIVGLYTAGIAGFLVVRAEEFTHIRLACSPLKRTLSR